MPGLGPRHNPNGRIRCEPRVLSILFGAVGPQNETGPRTISFRGLSASYTRWRTLGSQCVVMATLVARSTAEWHDGSNPFDTAGDARHIRRRLHAVDPHHPRDHPVPADGVRRRECRSHPDADHHRPGNRGCDPDQHLARCHRHQHRGEGRGRLLPHLSDARRRVRRCHRRRALPRPVGVGWLLRHRLRRDHRRSPRPRLQDRGRRSSPCSPSSCLPASCGPAPTLPVASSSW